MKSTRLESFPLSAITLRDTELLNAQDKEYAYLYMLDPDRLLAGFLEVAGIQPQAEKYGAWEQTEIRGHTLGHYMTALAQAYERTGDAGFYDRLTYIFSELHRTQASDGYLSAFPQTHYDRLENGETVWVPWYVMHKILAGLCAGWRATQNEVAYQTMCALGDWIYGRVSKWDELTRHIVVHTEYGGMNDVLYELYMITGKQEYLDAAHQFDELSLFVDMPRMHRWRGVSALTGRHANTMIPKLIGALQRYLATGMREELYLNAAEGFWDEVVKHQTYITGGNSDDEHFVLSGALDAHRSCKNNETCNVYNMLKLSMLLFQVKKDVKYLHFYEKAFVNHIRASQDPQTGMTTYFQPMQTGGFRVFSTPFDDFWCCTGTGMETFSKLGEGFAYHDEDTLYIALYHSMELKWPAMGVSMEQEADIYTSHTARFTMHMEQGTKRFALVLREPDWLAAPATVTVCGQPAEVTRENGFLRLDRPWQDGDEVVLRLCPALRYEALADNPHSIAFQYGPLALAAELGQENMRVDICGVMCDYATVDVHVPTEIHMDSGREHWLSALDMHLVRRTGELTFDLRGTDRDGELVFRPFYSQNRERYGVYWIIQ